MHIQFERINSEPSDILEKLGNIALYPLRTAFGRRVKILNNTDYSSPSRTVLPQWAKVSIAALTIIFCVITIAGFVCTHYSATYKKAIRKFVQSERARSEEYCIRGAKHVETLQTNAKFEAFLADRIPPFPTEYTQASRQSGLFTFFEPTMFPFEFDEDLCSQYPNYKLTDIGGRHGWTALESAAHVGNLTLVRHILMNAPDELFFQRSSTNALLRAVEAPLAVRFTLIKDLINAGMPVNINVVNSTFEDGSVNVLDKALKGGEENLEIITYLLSVGAVRTPTRQKMDWLDRFIAEERARMSYLSEQEREPILNEIVRRSIFKIDQKYRPLLRKVTLPLRQKMASFLLANSRRPEGARLEDDILQVVLSRLTSDPLVVKPFTKGEALFA